MNTRRSSSAGADGVEGNRRGDVDMGWALGAVLRAYVRAVDAVVNDLPGGARGYQVLAAVDSRDGIGQERGGDGREGQPTDDSRRLHQGELARTLGIDRTVFTYLVDDLEAADLIERHADPLDRRRRSITLTPQGREALATHRRAIEQMEEFLMAPLGGDADQFRRLLGRLAPQAANEDRMADLCRMAQELGVAAPGSNTTA